MKKGLSKNVSMGFLHFCGFIVRAPATHEKKIMHCTANNSLLQYGVHFWAETTLKNFHCVCLGPIALYCVLLVEAGTLDFWEIVWVSDDVLQDRCVSENQLHEINRKAVGQTF